MQALAVSPTFKKAASKSLLAIAAFILVYLILFALSLAFVALCFYGGLAVITGSGSFLGIVAGLGIIASGVMILIFLVKFMFTSSKTSEEDSIEVFEEDQPLLFQTINSIAERVGTSKPKRVFLTPDVNASVSYNSTFWSMFLPIRKNLRIGLGLVNSLNVSELEAVIAHEFGHFSQKSMKVGSWVYQVNRIIYDMLFNNSSFGNTLQAMANLHGILYIIALITSKISEGIQWILRKMYTVVNKAYLNLSREMEFHADHVAASLFGTNNIIHSLKRVELSSSSYDYALDLCNKALAQNKSFDDFFSAHRLTVKQTGEIRKMSFRGDLPLVTEDQSSITSKVNFKDQWSSHPTIEERHNYLLPFNLEGEVNDASAWELFHNAENLRKDLTQKLYRNVEPGIIQGTMELPQLEELMYKDEAKYTYPSLFKEYYYSRSLEPFNVVAVASEPFIITDFEKVFTDEVAQMPKALNLAIGDRETVQAIHEGRIDTRTFDFDGRKYTKKEAPEVIAILDQQIKDMQGEIKKMDALLFRYFYAIAPLAEAEGLKKDYEEFFKKLEASKDFFGTLNALMDAVGPIYQGGVSVDTVNAIIKRLKEEHEVHLKRALKEWYANFSDNPELQKSITEFLASDYQYFHNEQFFDNETSALHGIVNESWNGVNIFLFETFKKIAEKQAGIEEKRRVERSVVI